jgi:hypothetical protein
MSTFSEVFGSMVAGLAVRPFFWAVALLIFVYVVTRNYRSLREEPPPLLWPPGEEALAQIDVNWLFMRTRTILTNRRMLQWRVSWFLSRRKLKTISLRDVRSVVLHRQMNWGLLLAGAYMIGSYNPVALVLVLVGLQARLYTVRANTPFSQMPVTRVVVTTAWRAQLGELVRFYRDTQSIWSRASLHDAVPAVSDGAVSIGNDGETNRETDFAWGRPALVFIIAMTVAGLIQHVFEPHVSFDDFVFTPLYLGLPVAIASRSVRDALWVACFGLIGLIAIKFPGGGFLGFLTADGGFPAWPQYAGTLITLLAVTLAANGIARLTSASFAPAAILLWVLFAAVYIPDAFSDLSTYSKIALAMAASIALRPVDEWLARPTLPAVRQVHHAN